MANLTLPHHWTCIFTNNFLNDFYGNTAYFNFEAIADEAKPKILARMQQYYQCFFSWHTDTSLSSEERLEILSTLRNELQHIQTTGNVYEYQGQCYEFDWLTIEQDFIQDLFAVTAVPMSFAYGLCKGETPNGDCFSSKKTQINVKYNCQLIQYMINHCIKV
jgi:hypothetical protein